MSSLKYLLLLGSVALVANGELIKAGDFQNYVHGIAGEVFVKDEKTLVIKGFTYDGAGPDAFFWAGTSEAPSTVGTILPYPFKGEFYDYESRDAPILSGRFNGEEIKLTLPETLKASDIKWLSVWCRAFQVNFGDVFFNLEDVLKEQEEESIPEELPPPIIEPVHNAHDPNRHDEEWKNDPDAYAEAESESEPENAASSFSVSSFVLVLAAAYLF